MASKKVGEEVNSDKNKYIIMSPEENAGRTNNIKSDGRSFEREEDFK